MQKHRFWQPSIKIIFAEELAAETEKYELLPWHSGERTLKELPPLLRHHLIACGYAGKESVVCCQIRWKNTFLKFRPKGEWKSTACLQVNFVPDPARLVLMRTCLWGLFSFAARDKYQTGKGNMLIRLLGRLTLSEDNGRKMDQAELVTILAETMILPVYALQPYTTWETVDKTTVKGTIRHGDVTASGLFHFNEQGLLCRFETEDRYYAVNGRYHAYRWTTEVTNYIRRGDLSFPSSYRAAWQLPGGAYDYFKGELSRLEFNSTILADSLYLRPVGQAENTGHEKPKQDTVDLVEHSQPDVTLGTAIQQATDTENGLDDQEQQRVAS